MDTIKKFRDIIIEDSTDNIDNIEEPWTKQDLIELIQEEYLSDSDIAEITDLVIDIIEYREYEAMSDYDDDYDDYNDYNDKNIDERMTTSAKKEAKRRRRKPAYKRAMKKRAKCQKKYADKIKKSKNTNTPFVCNVHGKLVKGLGRAERRKLAKTRKRNKNKIIK